MTTPRLAALAAALTLVLALGACGGDDNGGDEPAKKDTTTERAATQPESKPDPAVKQQMQAAVGDYNRGYQRFFSELKDNGGNFERLQASVSDYRDVIYDFDKQIRAITFPDDLVPQVNAILENNRLLIEQLDGIGNARGYDQAINLYDRFLRVREPQVKAVNRLLDQL